MEIGVIYEDGEIAAVDKPSGLLIHGYENSNEATLTDWVIANYPEAESVGEPLKLNSGEVIMRPGIVHRIDKETSGIILIAKTQKAFQHLKKQFQNKEVEKIYRAFVWGKFTETKGVINKPIGRSATDFRKKSAEKGMVGVQREAITEYWVIKQSGENAYLEIKPKTGRTHQIRVHLKSINHPIVCDTLYAPKKPPALGFNRLALHAYSITFKNLAGDIVEAEVPLPADFLQAESLISKSQIPNHKQIPN